MTIYPGIWMLFKRLDVVKQEEKNLLASELRCSRISQIEIKWKRKTRTG